MTSISATTTNSYSPLDRLKSELTKEVSAGTISSSDEFRALVRARRHRFVAQERRIERELLVAALG